MKLNTQGIKDNLQNIAGIIVGMTICKPTGVRFGKESRGTAWFSTVSANQAAEGFYNFFPYKMIIK